MSETLRLPGEVYQKLAQGAANRGMTIESLLEAVSELVVLPEQPRAADRRRSARIEKRLDHFRAGRLSADDRAELDGLIDADYQEATVRADRLIRAKQRLEGLRWRSEDANGPVRKTERDGSGTKPG
jgi:hypothetical protein